MTMTLQEISDRMEIQDLMVAYCYAIDRQNWDELDNVFLPDSLIDYSEMVNFRGNLAQTKEFLKSGLGDTRSAYQHSISTSQIKIEGDIAHGRTLCSNPMVVTLPSGESTRVLRRASGIATYLCEHRKAGVSKSVTKRSATVQCAAGIAGE